MRRLQAILALLALVVGNAILPLCACAVFVEHHCCCDERVDEPTVDAGPKSCCEEDATAASVVQVAGLVDAAVATLPRVDSLIPPQAVERADARPRSPVIAMPRGPPKIPIFLLVHALLR